MACCNSTIQLCDAAGGRVVAVLDTGAGTTAYFNENGTPFAGDPTTLVVCSVDTTNVVDNGDGTATITNPDTLESAAVIVGLNVCDGAGGVAPFDPATGVLTQSDLMIGQAFVDHEAARLQAGCNDVDLHRSIVIGADHVAGTTGVGGPEFIGVSHADSDDADTGQVTTHHLRTVIASTLSQASGAGSAVVASDGAFATGEEAFTASSRGASRATANNSTVLSSGVGSEVLGRFSSVISTNNATVNGVRSSAIATQNVVVDGPSNAVVASENANTLGAGGVVLRSAIIGAQGSDIAGPADNALIGGTTGSDIVASNDSAIIGGSQNRLDTANRSATIGGVDNVIDSDESGTFVASAGLITGNVQNSAIVAAQGGTIDAGVGPEFNNVISGGTAGNLVGVSNSGVFAGRTGVINPATGGSDAIIAGETNTITGAVEASKSAIIAGLNNTITDASQAVVVGGTGNTVGATHDNSVVVGGAGIASQAANTVYVPRLNIANIPVAPGGLVAGDVWNNGGVLTIV